MVYCLTTVELSACGHVWHHATSGTLQNPKHTGRHLHIHEGNHTHKNTVSFIKYCLWGGCQLCVCNVPALPDLTCQEWQRWSIDFTHLSYLAGVSWLRLSGRDNCHHKGLREERTRCTEKESDWNEEAQDEGLKVKWQESQEMRLRAYRKVSPRACEVEDRHETASLSVSFIKTLVFTSGTCLDTQWHR